MAGDGEVVEQDPGLPDAANKLQKHVPKNVPPTDAASAVGYYKILTRASSS